MAKKNRLSGLMQQKAFRYATKICGRHRTGLTLNGAIHSILDYNSLWHEVKSRDDNSIRGWFKDKYLSQSDLLFAPKGNGFYGSLQWKKLRVQVLNHYGYACMKCNSWGIANCVDHIYPRRNPKYKHLQLEFCNMQVLCSKCNLAKSDKKYFDLRPPQAEKWIEELKSKLEIAA